MPRPLHRSAPPVCAGLQAQWGGVVQGGLGEGERAREARGEGWAEEGWGKQEGTGRDGRGRPRWLIEASFTAPHHTSRSSVQPHTRGGATQKASSPTREVLEGGEAGGKQHSMEIQACDAAVGQLCQVSRNRGCLRSQQGKAAQGRQRPVCKACQGSR